MEKSYLDIKVSFLHIVVLLIGVIIIGIFLFYLGYQAGKSSIQNKTVKAELLKNHNKPKEIKIIEEKPIKKKESNIKDEIKLHKKPVKKTASNTKKKIAEKPLKKEPYYSIQVGAFSSFSNAKKYSEKFRKLGYQSEILSTSKENKTFFRVRVGNFKNITKANKEKKKLEKMEKKKFSIVKSG